MMFDGGYGNGMIAVLERRHHPRPANTRCHLYAKVFDEDADGDGVNAESVDDGGDVNEDITALYVQFGDFEYSLGRCIPRGFCRFFQRRHPDSGRSCIGRRGSHQRAPPWLKTGTNPADAPFDGEWVKISAAYDFQIVPANVAITVHCAFPSLPGLDGALDITAMAMDHFVLSGPSFTGTAVELWPLF